MGRFTHQHRVTWPEVDAAGAFTIATVSRSTFEAIRVPGERREMLEALKTS